MVDIRGDGPTLSTLHLHGQDGPGESGSTSAAIDGPGAARHAWCQDPAVVTSLWFRRRAAWPRRGGLRQRPGAGNEYPAWRRTRLRDRTGATGPWPNPPLHAADRGGGGRPRAHV